MSVCTFGTEELANLANVIIGGDLAYQNWATRIDALCTSLSLVSQANVACFNDRYQNKGAKANPRTAAEIRHELELLDTSPGDPKALASALSTARLLHYNCDDSGGDFTLKVEGAHAALIHVLEGLAVALARQAGVRT